MPANRSRNRMPAPPARERPAGARAPPPHHDPARAARRAPEGRDCHRENAIQPGRDGAAPHTGPRPAGPWPAGPKRAHQTPRAGCPRRTSCTGPCFRGPRRPSAPRPSPARTRRTCGPSGGPPYWGLFIPLLLLVRTNGSADFDGFGDRKLPSRLGKKKGLLVPKLLFTVTIQAP